MNQIVFIGRTVLESENTNGIQRVGGSLFNTLLTLEASASTDNIKFITNTSPLLEVGFQSLKSVILKIPFSITPLEQYESGYLVTSHDHGLDQVWTIQHLKQFDDAITAANIIVVDMYRVDFIVYITRINPRARVILTGTSSELIGSIKPFANKISILKIDMRQAKALTNVTIHDLVDCGLVQMQLRDLGFHNVVITLNRLGTYFFTDDDNGHYHSKIISRKAFTHSGDAFFAGMIYAMIHGSPLSIMALEGIHQSGNFIKRIMDTPVTLLGENPQ